MTIDMYDRIVKQIDSALNGSIDGLPNIRVVKKIPNNISTYPIVVVSERRNSNYSQTTNGEEGIDRLGYEVEIYSTDLPINKKMVSSVDICRKIEQHIDDIMGRQMRMSRTGCSPISNIDTTIYRVLMTYSCRVNLFRQKII